MSTPDGSGWPRRRLHWIGGAALILGIGVLVGAVLGSIVIGLLIGAAVSIGWLIAYQSWRGRQVGLDDPDDDGARL